MAGCVSCVRCVSGLRGGFEPELTALAALTERSAYYCVMCVGVGVIMCACMNGYMSLSVSSVSVRFKGIWVQVRKLLTDGAGSSVSVPSVPSVGGGK